MGTSCLLIIIFIWSHHVVRVQFQGVHKLGTWHFANFELHEQEGRTTSYSKLIVVQDSGKRIGQVFPEAS